MTIESASIIRNMLLNDGVYIDNGGEDPQAYSIWKYFATLSQRQVYKVIMNGPAYLQESGFVSKPVLLWSQVNGLTDDGKEFLKTGQ